MTVYECPKIEGRLDGKAWQVVPPITLVLAETGRAATKKTTARVCWDHDRLYIAFWCEDQDIRATFTERDDPVYTEEVVEAFLCPTGDLASYFEINVSPRNVVFDATIDASHDPIPEFQARPEWNCSGLHTSVIVDGILNDPTVIDIGWSANLSIPFASLERETPKPGEEWRVNLYRIDRSPEPVEHQAWSPTLVTPANFHVPRRFGTLVFRDSEG